LIWLGSRASAPLGWVKQSEEYARPLRRGSGDNMYTRKAYATLGSPKAWSAMTNRKPANGALFQRLFFCRKVSTREPLGSFMDADPVKIRGGVNRRKLSQSQSHRPVQTTLHVPLSDCASPLEYQRAPDARIKSAFLVSRRTFPAMRRITIRWKLDLILLNPPKHTSSIPAAGVNFATSL
jgi:hypothetical protein